MKIDVLVDHFAETRKHDGPISFLDFLVMHYVTDDGNNNDNDRDEQLPFKSHYIVADNSNITILNQAEGFYIRLSVDNKTNFSPLKNPFIKLAPSNAVWNPPRVS